MTRDTTNAADKPQPTSDALDALPEPQAGKAHIHLGFTEEGARTGFVLAFNQAGNPSESLERIIEGDGLDKDGETPIYFVHLLNSDQELVERVMVLQEMGILKDRFCTRVGLSLPSPKMN